MSQNASIRKKKARQAKGLCIGCGESPCICKNTQDMRAAKELARVEAAIRDRTKSELYWAAEYCRTRARGAWNPKHQDRSEYWIRLKARVEEAMKKALP